MSNQAIGIAAIVLIICALIVALQFKLSSMPGRTAGLILPAIVILGFVASVVTKGPLILSTGYIFPLFIVSHFLSFSMLLIYLLEKKEK